MLPTSVAGGPTGPDWTGGNKRKGEFSCFSQDEAEQGVVQLSCKTKLGLFTPPP